MRVIGKMNKDLIMSTGMARMSEVEDALGILVQSGTKKEKSEQLEQNGREMITRIAALLPAKNHGICLGDPNISIYQKENGIIPKSI